MAEYGTYLAVRSGSFSVAPNGWYQSTELNFQQNQQGRVESLPDLPLCLTMVDVYF